MALSIKDQKFGKAVRKTFAKTPEIAPIPELLAIQTDSYNEFLTRGIRSVLDEFSPVVDYSGKAKLYFLDFSFVPVP